MGEPKRTGRTGAPQGMLLPPHLRDPAKEGTERNPGPAEAASPPALPCIRTEGACALRTTPGARFQCIFSGQGCSYLTRAGEKPFADVPRSPGGVHLAAGPHLETGVSPPTSHVSPPNWYLPDGRPVYRDALVKRWEALGRPAIVLSKAVTVVDLPKWLAQDDVPIPPRMKWGTWRLDLEDMARVADFLAEKGKEIVDVKSDPASGLRAERGQDRPDVKREERMP